MRPFSSQSIATGLLIVGWRQRALRESLCEWRFSEERRGDCRADRSAGETAQGGRTPRWQLSTPKARQAAKYVCVIVKVEEATLHLPAVSTLTNARIQKERSWSQAPHFAPIGTEASVRPSFEMSSR